MDIKQLQDLVSRFRDDRNWKQFHNGKDMALSLSLEAAELLELTQWKSEQEVSDYFADKKGPLADELADVLYWTLLIAKDFDIDLNEALQNKIKKNELKYPIELARDSKKGKVV
jgi:NTP pyrophosphatase (non-canonical NTP hydrolase)